MKNSVTRKFLNFINDDSGPTAVEYAIMIGLILLVCITAIAIMGQSTSDSWSDTSDKVDQYMNGN